MKKLRIANKPTYLTRPTWNKSTGVNRHLWIPYNEAATLQRELAAFIQKVIPLLPSFPKDKEREIKRTLTELMPQFPELFNTLKEFKHTAIDKKEMYSLKADIDKMLGEISTIAVQVIAARNKIPEERRQRLIKQTQKIKEDFVSLKDAFKDLK